MNVTGIVIAGGRSSRMGRNKALLPIGGLPLIERLVREMEQITDRLIIISNDEAPYRYLGKEIIPDLYKQAGPLAGIHAGLSASESSWNLITACDMPFVNKAALHRLRLEAETICAIEQELSSSEPTEAVIPRNLDGVLPLLAVYNRSVLPDLDAALREEQLRLIPWTQTLRAAYIPASELCREAGLTEEMLSYNMNRPGDYEKACRIYEELGSR
ncbi:molybdenum cofactor guanylyltransferase [Paenibacillus zeisoli]|uniref:Probable molybdenum cofactor guanylyltransferase n=1 Tax=Paenibacillus zeisoli TaxID=2496267 RepID=A0A433XGR5_9BACL|nr:molybdenum cofactor guanylyltransferase [Paenibacillus zeisoli]RUT33339.1 molybdenum cofactor guanylyltransferase [Paenibacillus zeisoli]